MRKFIASGKSKIGDTFFLSKIKLCILSLKIFNFKHGKTRQNLETNSKVFE